MFPDTFKKSLALRSVRLHCTRQ